MLVISGLKCSQYEGYCETQLIVAIRPWKYYTDMCNSLLLQIIFH